jgi:hypothetical protein
MPFLRQMLMVSCAGMCLWNTVQQKYLSDHTVTAQIVVLHQAECNLQSDAAESHVSLCVEIKTIQIEEER